MMKVDRYEPRLRAMYFKRKFNERVDEIQPVGHAHTLCSLSENALARSPTTGPLSLYRNTADDQRGERCMQ